MFALSGIYVCQVETVSFVPRWFTWYFTEKILYETKSTISFNCSPEISLNYFILFHITIVSTFTFRHPIPIASLIHKQSNKTIVVYVNYLTLNHYLTNRSTLACSPLPAGFVLYTSILVKIYLYKSILMQKKTFAGFVSTKWGVYLICLTNPSRYISGDSMSSLLWFLYGANILLPNPARWWNF
jgi:hypothetical protein